MADDNGVLAAISALHSDMLAHIEELAGRIDGLAVSTEKGFAEMRGRFSTIDKRLETIGTKVDRHETRIEALETRS